MKHNGRFVLGEVPWNKGLKGVNGISETTFKKGPLHTGEQHVSWKGGVQKSVNDCTYLWDGNGKRIRRPKKIWEAYYGETLPKNWVIYHLDGDNSNDDPMNLEGISRGELLKRNRAKNGKNDK